MRVTDTAGASTFASLTLKVNGQFNRRGQLDGSRRDHHIQLKLQLQNYNAIDPCFATDSANNPWLSFGSWWSGIYVTKLSTSNFKPTGSWSHIAYNSPDIENSQIVYHGNYYYLFASVGTCCDGASSTYHIVYGRATSITGPYCDKNGVNMLNDGGTTLDAGGSRFIAPGGESIFNNNGSGICARHKTIAQLFCLSTTSSGSTAGRATE